MLKSDLLKHMPGYYRTSKVIDNINTANASELTSFKENLTETLNQFFVDTSTYSLERWEKELGLEVSNNYDTEFRRTRIKSKLRGKGTVTVNLIKNVANSFDNGSVEVIESPETYSFKLKFISIMGIPPNLDDLEKAIEDIKPAHLAVSYEFTYNTYNTIGTQTYSALEAYTYADIMTHTF